MGTYNFTIGSTAGAPAVKGNKHFVLSRELDVPQMILDDATLAAAAKLTAGDIIQAIVMPARSVLKNVVVEIVTAGTAGGAIDVGLAGGTQAFAALNAVTLGTTIMAHTVAWGVDTVCGVVFSASDTIDVQFIADETVGKIRVYVEGYMLDEPTVYQSQIS